MRRVILTMALLLSACGPKTETTNTTVTDMNSTEGMDTMSDNMTAVDGSMNGGMMANDTMGNGGMMSNDTVTTDRHTRAANIPPPERPAYCEAMQSFMLSERCDWLTVQKVHLQQGIAAFRPPTSMTVGIAQDLALAIGPASDPMMLAEAIGSGTSPATRIDLKISRHMTASLSGSGFTVEPSGDIRHDLGGGGASVWQWRVMPLAAGPQTLLLKVRADAVDEQDSPTEIGLASRTFAISVDVTPLDWFNRLLTTLSDEIGLGTEVLGGLQKLLIVLAATIAAAAGVYLGIRRFAKPPRDGTS